VVDRRSGGAAAAGEEVTDVQRRALALAKRIAVSIDGIRGVDFGYVYKRRRRTRGFGIRFHVERKRPLRSIATAQRLPARLDGIRCDVVEARYGAHAIARAPADPREHAAPLRPGMSIGSLARGHTGTLGAIVRDRDGGAPCILGSWHVLGGSAQSRPGDAIAQPGPDDLGPTAPTVVAKLWRSADLAHGVDAAIARIDDGIPVDPIPLGLASAPTSVVAPTAGMALVKSGRSTGVTHALVDGEEGSYVIDYSAFGSGTRWMDAIRLIPDPTHADPEISLTGDSGALFVNGQSAAALLFGGEDDVSPQAEYALAHPLAAVFSELRIDLWHS
jgi:endonuclease G, mitochondrial